MMKKTHLSIGVAATIFLANTGLLGIFSFLGLFGSIAPDWDFKLHIKHRTLTHCLLTLFISSFLIYEIDRNFGIIWFSNYLLHLTFDSLTIRGVPWFYPFNKKRYGLKLFRTGGAFDFLFFLLAIFIIIIEIDSSILLKVYNTLLLLKNYL